MAADPKTPSDKQRRWERIGFQIQEAQGLQLDRLLRGWGFRRALGESDRQLRRRALELLARFNAPPPRTEGVAPLAAAFVVFVLLLAGLAFLATTGCGTPTVRLTVFDERGTNPPEHELAELPAEVEAACELLPVGCEVSRFRSAGLGRVELHLVPDDMRRGRVIGRRPCWASVMARGSDPAAIAHELGHVFGLDHVDEAGRLMNPVADHVDGDEDYGQVLDEDEIDQVLDSAGAMEACWPS
jgi:hypothetical protein